MTSVEGEYTQGVQSAEGEYGQGVQSVAGEYAQGVKSVLGTSPLPYQEIFPTGVSRSAAIGSPSIAKVLSPTGVPSVASIGSPTVANAFDPSALTNLQVWWVANDVYEDSARTTPATDDGDVVGSVTDQSGGGHHLSQSTTINKPSLQLAEHNGEDAIQTGTNSYMTAPNWSYDLTDITLWMVVKRSNSSFSTILAQGDYGSTKDRVFLFGFQNGTNPFRALIYQDEVGPTFKHYLVNNTDTNLHLWTVHWAASTDIMRIWLDGVEKTPTKSTDNAMTTLNNNSFEIAFNAARINSAFGATLAGDIPEIVWAGATTDSEITSCNDYLIDKYGL